MSEICANFVSKAVQWKGCFSMTHFSWRSAIAGGGGHEADDARAEGRDHLHPPLQRCLQRGVQGGRARWRCSKVAFLCFLI